MFGGFEEKKCKGVTKNATEGVFNSMTTESVCLVGRNNIEND